MYIVSSRSHTTLYTGVTSDLVKRIAQHKSHFYPQSFSARYNCTKLVYYASFDTIMNAIIEEKRIKAGSRAAKIRLIEGMNPGWKDLWDEISG